MKPTVLITMVLALSVQINANIIYVIQGATGNGSSWSNAFGSFTSAIAAANTGDEIWIAKGTYHPTITADRTASFLIPDGVKVYGGFEGIETELNQRNFVKNATILSGELGVAGLSDNSFTIVYFDNVGENTVLDGFTLTAGSANGELNEANANRCGGAIYVDGSNGSSKPIIANCTFTGNFARDGAAVYNNGRGGESSPTFINCTFKNNEAGLDGGAIYNDGRLAGKSNPILTNCIFERNMGTYGGAICNATESGTCNLTLNNCTFKENAAYLRGGALFSLNGDEKCYLEMLDCLFENNFPSNINDSYNGIFVLIL